MPDRLRICVVSEDLTLPLDEGLKKLVIALSTSLARLAEVHVISADADDPNGAVPPSVYGMASNELLLSRKLWRTVRAIDPDVMLYVPEAAATRNSFLRLTVLRLYAPRARTVMLSVQPRTYGRFGRLLARLLRPSVLLVQSLQAQEILHDLGIPTRLLPSGVDLDIYHPVSSAEKSALRSRYGLPDDAFVVLHVGHLAENRNVLLLNRLRRDVQCETVLCASTWSDNGFSAESARVLRTALREGGTRVVDWYVENIAELYASADCYLFPIQVECGAIDMPLSVLEALACGVPVVSTPFGQLPVWFHDGEGFSFASSDDDLVTAVQGLQQASRRPRPEQVRLQATKLGWDAVAHMVLDQLTDPTGSMNTTQAQTRTHAEEATRSMGRPVG